MQCAGALTRTWLQARTADEFAASGPLPAVPASQHGLSAAGAALAANTAVRGLFRAALSSVVSNGLLPLPNASRLSDVMAAIDPSWAARRKKHTPFSRLFWAYAADVAAAGLALVPARDGFALVANGGSGNAGMTSVAAALRPSRPATTTRRRWRAPTRRG